MAAAIVGLEARRDAQGHLAMETIRMSGAPADGNVSTIDLVCFGPWHHPPCPPPIAPDYRGHPRHPDGLSTFSKNRERFLGGDVAQQLLTAILDQPRVQALMSDEHFSVDGTLIQVWASQKSFQPKPASA